MDQHFDTDVIKSSIDIVDLISNDESLEKSGDTYQRRKGGVSSGTPIHVAKVDAPFRGRERFPRGAGHVPAGDRVWITYLVGNDTVCHETSVRRNAKLGKRSAPKAVRTSCSTETHDPS